MHPPNQPLMLSAKQGGIGYHFYRVFGMTRPGARTPNLPVKMFLKMNETFSTIMTIMQILG